MSEFSEATMVPSFEPPEPLPASVAPMVVPSEMEKRREAIRFSRQEKRDIVRSHATPNRVADVMDGLYSVACGTIIISEQDSEGEWVEREIRVKPDAKAAKVYLELAGVDKDLPEDGGSVGTLTEEEFVLIARIAQRYGKALDPGLKKVVNTAEKPKEISSAQAS